MNKFEADRLCDLMRQGFMKSKPSPKVKEIPPVIACEDCLNWHKKGKHTLSKDERRANREKRQNIPLF
jgi:hypothetical protein